MMKKSLMENFTKRKILKLIMSFQYFIVFTACSIYFANHVLESVKDYCKRETGSRVQLKKSNEVDFPEFSICPSQPYNTGMAICFTQQNSSISMECLHISKNNFWVKYPYGCSLYLLITIFQQDLSFSKEQTKIQWEGEATWHASFFKGNYLKQHQYFNKKF